MLTVADPFVAETFKEELTVPDPARIWRDSSDLKRYIENFGEVTRVKVERVGWFGNTAYYVTAAPRIPEAARRTLKGQSRSTKARRTGRHRTTGPAIKLRRSADLVSVVASAHDTANRLPMQR